MTEGTLDGINRLLRQPFGNSTSIKLLKRSTLQEPSLAGNNLEAMTVAMQRFLAANKDPTATPPLQGDEAVDDMRAILAALKSEQPRENPRILLLLLKVLKVLMRKQGNRRALGQEGVRTMTDLLRSSACLDACITSECANVVLNMCYDSENVRHFVELGCLPALEPLIRSGHEQLKASSSVSKRRSLCHRGRRNFAFLHDEMFGRLLTIRYSTSDSGMVGAVVRLLGDASPRVQARALGTVHNLSTDARSIGIIREEGGMSLLVRLLRSHEAHACGAAAGTIQNLSREERSRAVLTSLGAVEPLADLLVGRHVKSQARSFQGMSVPLKISAAGALVNIVGPDLKGAQQRQLLRRVLTDGIVLGVMESCMA